MNNKAKLYESIKALYAKPLNKTQLLFHGWHHVKFVHDKAIEFGKSINANLEIVAVAALVHDLNYIFSEDLSPNGAVEIMHKYVVEAGYDTSFADNIIDVVKMAHTGTRKGKNLSLEAKALSDADTLFKALPITPILFTSKFLTETGYNIEKLSNKIVEEQAPLIESDQYFYTKLAKEKYMGWALTNLKLWENLKESLNDDDVLGMLSYAKNSGII